MEPGTARLILVRHGEVDANRNFHYLGHRDDELNLIGLDQAESVANALAELPLDGIVTSPLRRARATAERVAAAAGIPVETDERLIELDFGTWEGRSREEVILDGSDSRAVVEEWEKDPSRPTPGGESLDSLQQRVVDCADEIARLRSSATVVVVSHMGPIKVLLCAALRLSLRSAGRIFLDPATISVVDWGPASVVRLVNSHAHLGFAGARWLRGR
jgi:probable phosphoglycerate mutase